MQTFFDDIDTLHRFTLNLEHHRETLACSACSKNDQFISHGFVYKKHTQGQQRTIGKRILCSNRNGRSGCGRTIRLYLSTEVPLLQYTAEHLLVFLTALLAGLSIQTAYSQATCALDPRNAYRWLNKLQHKLIDYRCVVKIRPAAPALMSRRPRRLRLLLTTLQQLFSTLSYPPCQQYQQRHQKAFI